MFIKYSVVIPTRNRANYLGHAIQSVLNSSRNDIELIVSNNFSTDGTSDLLANISDPRLKVISPNVSLPMAGHYEFAISQAKGEWITILGDDDAVMPYIFESLDKYISRYPRIDIISSARAYYFWEGCEDQYGTAVVSYSSRPKTQIRSTKNDLYAVLKGVRSCFDMPQIYTAGIVKRSLYEEVKIKSGGCFYHSIIPDMYSVVALSLVRDQYLRVEEPLFWVGTSNRSMARSDRIYRDAEQFVGDPTTKHICVPRAISKDVSYVLHSSAFSPMYVFECLLQSPLNSQVHRQKGFRAIVLAAILNAVRKRGHSEYMKILNEILVECSRYNISKIQVKSFCLFFGLNSNFAKLFALPGRVLRRLDLFPNSLQLRSTSRSKFPTILDASRAISVLRSKKIKSEYQ